MIWYIYAISCRAILHLYTSIRLNNIYMFLSDVNLSRYKIYIEGTAWSVSEKYILACDSLSLIVKPQNYDFFTRGLMPVQHYWPVRDNNKCRSIKFAVEWGNNHKQKVIWFLVVSFWSAIYNSFMYINISLYAYIPACNDISYMNLTGSEYREGSE